MILNKNNNYSVLPFYDSIDEQNHRRSYSYGEVYPLYCQINSIMPFQIVRKDDASAITSVKMYTKDGEYVMDLLTELQATGLQVVSPTGYDYNIIVYTGIMPLATNMLQGQHYLVVRCGTHYYYSEVFTLVTAVSPYLCVEWYDESDLIMDIGRIVYNNPRFINRLFLCTELGKPDYTFDEEGEERDGFFFPEKQLSEKTYKCSILAPEYLCDVMRFIRMADHVCITDKYGREYFPDTFLITPKWQEQGNLASVEIEFQTATVAKKIGNGMLPHNNGDFNNDFNNDFLNS